MTLASSVLAVSPAPYLYNPYFNVLKFNTPYYNAFGGYGNAINSYHPVVSRYPEIIPVPGYSKPPTLNILAEEPAVISNKFTVVPLMVVAKENTNLIPNTAQIMGVSKRKPIITVKTTENSLMQCTPAVKIILDEPITVISLKSKILFPSEIVIRHQNYKIPIPIGTVIVPISQNTYVSAETPVYVKEVYAIPNVAIVVDYVNNIKDVVVKPETDAVIVESEDVLPPKNVTIINFPDAIGEPVITIDEEDEELGKHCLICCKPDNFKVF